MRYIILIFILFFKFSYVNADAIYNLIKIPNLEVHKVDDVNGIKYLVSKRGFVIGDTNNIKCNGINNSDLDREFNTIQNNLRDYNSNFLRKINLKFYNPQYPSDFLFYLNYQIPLKLLYMLSLMLV